MGQFIWNLPLSVFRRGLRPNALTDRIARNSWLRGSGRLKAKG